MFLKQSVGYNKKIYLSFMQGFRDENGKSKSKTIQKIGYLDDFLKIYDDPIAHFKEVALQKSSEQINEFVIQNINSKIIDESNVQKNLGYSILKKIYYELDFNNFFKKKQSKLNIDYSLNDIFQLLIYSRILFPGSKKENFDSKDVFFETFDFSLKDLYRCLDYIYTYKDEIQSWLWNHTKDNYKRDTSTVYYDCTNYYFEISYNDEDLVDEFGNILEKGYRKKGPSKEHRPEPIIQMGLLMDKCGIPLSYNLFPGNISEKVSLRPALKKTKNQFNLGRVITVADRGLNTSDNTVFIAGKNDDETNMDGYVFGQSILSSDSEFKNYVLNNEEFPYTIDTFHDENDNEITFKHKSRIFAKTTQILKDGKRTSKFDIYQKQMVYYSEKYALKQKKQRTIVLEKAKDLIKNPGKYTRNTSVGAAGYITNIEYDKKTGEVIARDLTLNTDKIKQEEQYDGYYSIVTSELKLSDKEIRDIYKGLWKIEETFKITKSHLEARPVYVWTKEHIEAHFLTCFVSLVIVRLLEQKLNQKYSTEKMLNSLKKYTCSNMEHDMYIFNYKDEIINCFQQIFHIDLSHKYLTLSNIRNILNP